MYSNWLLAIATNLLEEALAEIELLDQLMPKLVRVGSGDLAPDARQVVLEQAPKRADFLITESELHHPVPHPRQ